MNLRPFWTRVVSALALAAGVVVLGNAVMIRGACGQDAPPNIILFYTDDQGWADTSVTMMADRPDSRSSYIRTPHLERLARDGMVFSSGYASSPVCSSSRDSILYGMTPARLHHSILLGKANRSADALTTPRAIKSANPNYVTAHFGKWGCSPKTPEAAGFDVSDGDTDNWHGDWQWVGGEKTPFNADDPKRIFSVTQRASAFIQEQVSAGRPFYMRISHYAVHVKLAALADTIQKYRADGHNEATATYAAMSENLDSGLGAVLDQLDELGIADNTYVIYSSDNGGGFDGNAPLQGGKASLWEGGLRVPNVVRGPNVPAGSYCDVPVVGWDFLPTFYELAGGSDPLPDALDGGSLKSLFEHGNDGRVKRNVQPLIFHYPWYDSVPMSAIRDGDYKLLKDLNTQDSRLFNLAADPGEAVDLSAQQPELKQHLLNSMNVYLDKVQAEDLEQLRLDREKALRAWIDRDRASITTARQQLGSSSGDERERLAAELASLTHRIRGNQAALDRVRVGRTLTAW